MQEKDIEGILHKVEEMKVVFAFGVKFVPFLEELLIFVQEMAPILNEMNRSIQESSSKMPEAAQQLDKVTSATELATNEILDRVDSMLGKLDEISKQVQSVNSRLDVEHQAVVEITEGVEKLLKVDSVRKQLAAVFELDEAREEGMRIKASVDKFLSLRVDKSVGQQVDQLVQDVQSDAFDIMNSLQVQDITSQQIEGAHAMLRSIQERLNGLITKFSEAEAPEMIRENKAFDAAADYTGAGGRQAGVDELFGSAGVETEAEEEPAPDEPSVDEILQQETAGDEPGQEPQAASSQDEIDSLFEDSAAVADEAPEQEATADAAEEESVDAQPSGQDEIDELLDWGDVAAGGQQEEDADGEAADEEAVEGVSGEELLDAALNGETDEAGEEPVAAGPEEPAAAEEAGQPEAEQEQEKKPDAGEEPVAAGPEEPAAAEEAWQPEAEQEQEKKPDAGEEPVAAGPEEPAAAEEAGQPEAEQKQEKKEEKPAADDSDGGASISQEEIDKLFG